ncbi:MAG: hypothetical protein ACO1OB_05515 [Archangium sp.]
MNFETFYSSAWQHPGMPWLLCAVALAFVLRVKDTTLRNVLLLFTFTTAMDAWLTGPLSPLPQGSLLARNVSIGFVIWGDVRLFVFLQKFRNDETTWRRAWLTGIALAFIVPVIQAIAIRSFPEAFVEERRIYLVYEAAFEVLGCVLLLSGYARSWVATSLLGFFVVQYALWVASDVLILAGQSWAFGLRVVPNAMYYGLFLMFAARRTST